MGEAAGAPIAGSAYSLPNQYISQRIYISASQAISATINESKYRWMNRRIQHRPDRRLSQPMRQSTIELVCEWPNARRRANESRIRALPPSHTAITSFAILARLPNLPFPPPYHISNRIPAPCAPETHRSTRDPFNLRAGESLKKSTCERLYRRNYQRSSQRLRECARLPANLPIGESIAEGMDRSAQRPME